MSTDIGNLDDSIGWPAGMTRLVKALAIGIIATIGICTVTFLQLKNVRRPLTASDNSASHHTAYDTVEARTSATSKLRINADARTNATSMLRQASSRIQKCNEGKCSGPTMQFLTPEDVQGVEKFVFFIGYPKSGHSIIGSMMDAHPNMIIAHEFMLFAKWAENPAQYRNKTLLFNALHQDSFRDSTKFGWRTARRHGKGYSLDINSSWQGRFGKLKVIGDKSGGKTTMVHGKSPIAFTQYYHQLAETVQVPIHVIHVVRNPYDMIATDALYHSGMYRVATKTKKCDNLERLKASTQLYFGLATGVQAMKRNLPLKVLEVRIEEFIRDPKNIIRGICSYLDLECPTEYVQECYDKAFKTVSRSRDLVVWDPATLALVNEKMKKYPFFQGYSFQEDFPQ